MTKEKPRIKTRKRIKCALMNIDLLQRQMNEMMRGEYGPNIGNSLYISEGDVLDLLMHTREALKSEGHGVTDLAVWQKRLKNYKLRY